MAQNYWDIPSGTIPGSDYKVKITSVVNGTVFGISDADFTIIKHLFLS